MNVRQDARAHGTRVPKGSEVPAGTEPELSVGETGILTH